MNEPIDELQLQRLVDGEMTEDDRREFLNSLDQQPQRWREVALAFVEEQIWRREIGREPRGHIDTEEPRIETCNPVRRASWGLRAALVASLLILPCLGFYFGQITRRASLPAVSENVSRDSDATPGGSNTVPFARQMARNGEDNRIRANERLASLGYRLDSETQYFSGQLDDGRQLVVPVRTVTVNYHGQ